MTPVLVDLLEAAEGTLGRITLNVEATLNSLTLEMVDLLQDQLNAWRNDAEVRAVFIDAAGESLLRGRRRPGATRLGGGNPGRPLRVR